MEIGEKTNLNEFASQIVCLSQVMTEHNLGLFFLFCKGRFAEQSIKVYGDFNQLVCPGVMIQINLRKLLCILEDWGFWLCVLSFLCNGNGNV